MKSATVLAALTALALPLAAQVPPGMFVAADTNGNLLLVEPFTGALTRLSTPSGFAPVRRVAVTRDPSVVLVAFDGANLTTDVAEVTITGSTVTGVRTLDTGIAGRAAQLDFVAPGASHWLTTDLNVYEIPLAGPAIPVFPTSSPFPIRGSMWLPGPAPNTEMLTVVLDDNGVTTVGEWHPPTLRMTQVPNVGRPMHAFYMFRTGEFAGNYIGVVNIAGHLIGLDYQTYVPQPLRSLGVPATGGTVRADTLELVLASASGMHRADGRVVSTGNVALRALSFRRFESTFTPYGVSCPRPGGVITGINLAGGGLPYPGNPEFEVLVYRVPPQGWVTLLAGLRSQNVDLTPAGLPGCRLLVDPVGAFPPRASDPAGYATFVIPIPEDRSLIGGAVHLQAIARDLQLPGGWFTTRAARLGF